MLVWFKRNQAYKALFHLHMVISDTVTKRCYWNRFIINREAEVKTDCRDDMQEHAWGKFVAEGQGSGLSNQLVIFQSFQSLKGCLKCLRLSPWTNDNNKERETHGVKTNWIPWSSAEIVPHWLYWLSYIIAQQIIWNRVDTYWLWTFGHNAII